MKRFDFSLRAAAQDNAQVNTPIFCTCRTEALEIFQWNKSAMPWEKLEKNMKNPSTFFQWKQIRFPTTQQKIFLIKIANEHTGNISMKNFQRAHGKYFRVFDGDYLRGLLDFAMGFRFRNNTIYIYTPRQLWCKKCNMLYRNLVNHWSLVIIGNSTSYKQHTAV